jgi:hypothetical protein
MEKALALMDEKSMVSDLTLKQYGSQLRSLYTKGAVYFDMDYGNPEAENLFLDRMKYDPLNIINLITQNWTGGTQKTYMNMVIVYLRSLIQDTYEGVNPTEETKKLIKNLEIYRKVWREKQKEYEAQTAQGIMTDKQRETFMTWSEFDDYISKAMDKYGPYSIQVLTLMLYRYQPLRADYASLQYNPEEAGAENYWTGEELVVNDYKTAKTYGTIRAKVDSMLEEYINQYISENDMSEGEWFFPDKKSVGDPISRNLLGKRIKGYFKQLGNENAPNLQQLRHIYLMNKYGEIKKSMDNDAFLMGHSKDTQNKYILNFDN